MSAIVIVSILVIVYLFFPMAVANGVKNRLCNRWKSWAKVFGLSNEES